MQLGQDDPWDRMEHTEVEMGGGEVAAGKVRPCLRTSTFQNVQSRYFTSVPRHTSTYYMYHTIVHEGPSVAGA